MRPQCAHTTPDGRSGRETSKAPARVSAGQGPDRLSQQSAPGGIRTPNLLIRNQMLYPLSYGRSVASEIPVRNVAKDYRLTPPRRKSAPQHQADSGAPDDRAVNCQAINTELSNYRDGPSARNRSTSDMASRSPF